MFFSFCRSNLALVFVTEMVVVWARQSSYTNSGQVDVSKWFIHSDCVLLSHEREHCCNMFTTSNNNSESSTVRIPLWGTEGQPKPLVGLFWLQSQRWWLIYWQIVKGSAKWCQTSSVAKNFLIFWLFYRSYALKNLKICWHLCTNVQEGRRSCPLCVSTQ